jgi:hypothetical protein
MTAPSLIFWGIFVLPLIAFLIWLVRQDKKQGWIGLIVLAFIIIGAITYTIIKKDGQQDPNTVQTHQGPQ